jgi:hypothetical protein
MSLDCVQPDRIVATSGTSFDSSFEPDVVQYHIHVNCMTEEVPPLLVRQMRSLRMKARRFEITDRGSQPLWIVSTALARAEAAGQRLEQVVELLAREPAMVGYVEKERVNLKDVRRFAVSAPPQRELNLPILRPSSRARACDLHLSRDLASRGDAIDRILESAGFYEVVGERKRIWTLLLASPEAGRILFDLFHRHFEAARGALKLELEYVESLVPIPASFELRPAWAIA